MHPDGPWADLERRLPRPRGGEGPTSGEGPGLLYVIHKHRARALHYDLRLEVGGAMPSWSVPKGPSLDSAVRRLALPTGDHDLDYRTFEGVIPGGYGAGAVMIWDRGTYDPEEETPGGGRVRVTEPAAASLAASRGLKSGNLKFFLHGQKLQGSFALVRTSGVQGREAWLLIKHRDEHCRPGFDANDHDYSAASGRTMAQIAESGAGR